MAEGGQRVVFLGARSRLFEEPPPHVLICQDRAGVEAAMTLAARPATWISFTPRFTDMLLEGTLAAPRAVPRGARLIALKPARAESVPALQGLFHPAVGLIDGFRWLPPEKLGAAITRDDANERFIGGSIDPKGKTIALLRGDLGTMVVPYSFFGPAGDGTRPNFGALRLTDYGRTVALGPYEASADAILYELDPGYRREVKSRRRRDDRTFGGALLRLRRQRRLSRGDFGPLSSRSIARLERGEVSKPRPETLRVIADRLGVRPEEIEDY